MLQPIIDIKTIDKNYLILYRYLFYFESIYFWYYSSRLLKTYGLYNVLLTIIPVVHILNNNVIVSSYRNKKKWWWFKKKFSNKSLLFKYKKKINFFINSLSNIINSCFLINKFVSRVNTLKILKRKIKMRKKYRQIRYSKIKFLFRRFSKYRKSNNNFNFLKFINLKKLSTVYRYKKAEISLKRRIFLNNKIVSKAIFYHYYKKPKYNNLLIGRPYYKTKIHTLNSSNKILTAVDKKKGVILLNYHKYLLWKIRKSRRCHWDMFKTGTINKWRYIKLFNKEVSKKYQYNQIHRLFINFLLNNGKVSSSWKHITILENYQLFLVNGEFNYKNFNYRVGDIIEICYGNKLNLWLKITNKIHNRIFYRLKRWSYLSYKNNERSWPVNKKTPKSFKYLNIGNKLFGKNIAIMRSLGLITILYKFNNIMSDPILSIHKTSIFKLNNWRYRFN